MKFDFVKTRIVYVVKVLLLLTVVLVCMMVAKVSAFMISADSIPKRIEKVMSAGSDDGDKLKELTSPYTEAAKKLKKKNLFMPPVPKKKNPVNKIDAIFGKEALINGKWYKAGDKVGDAQIVSVSAKSVMVRWNDEEKAISPFDHTAKLAEKKSGPKKTAQKTPEATKVVVEGKPKLRQRPEGRSGLSKEEARRLMAERRGSGERPDGRGRSMGSRRPRGSGRDGGRGDGRSSRSR